MAGTEEKALSDLRRMILDGTLRAGEKISEVSAAELLGISRTPVKLALARLEMIGLLKKRDGRGYQVREVRESEVENLLRVRGSLEGLAAWHLATDGLSESARGLLLQSLQYSEQLTGRELITAEEAALYQEANTLFHTTIMDSCSNEFLQVSYESIRHYPMAALGALSFDLDQPKREAMRIAIGHAQHAIVFHAIEARDAARAESVMREHSHATLNYARLFDSSDASQATSLAMAGSTFVNGAVIQ
jgi:GntR family transcriptional regulator of vanillate catabolism